MLNLVEQSELMDAQTRNKRKNRLLLYEESDMDDILRKRNDKLRAVQDLKPLYPWSDIFKQGDFIIRKYRGVSKQIVNTKQQIEGINDFRQDLSQARLEALNNHSGGPGRGNIKMDLDDADQKSSFTLSKREQELNLIENLSHQKLAVAIKNLRPHGKLFVSNNNILRMTALERATYLTETLGADQTTILSAANF